MAYHPSTSDLLIESDFFPDEIDSREAAQLLDLAHATDYDRDMDARLSDPAYLAWIEEQAAAYLDETEAS